MWQKVDSTLRMMANGLDGSSLRHRLLSNNLANVDTPNYKGKDVSFHTQLKSLMNEPVVDNVVGLTRTNEAHLAGQAQTVSQTPFQIKEALGRVREDGNSVNVDVEMAKLAENNIYYSTLTTIVAKKYKMLDRAIIKGGE